MRCKVSTEVIIFGLIFVLTGLSGSFYKLDNDKIRGYVRNNRKLSALLGISKTTQDSEIQVVEVGDGNLNFVYIIEGPKDTSNGVIGNLNKFLL